ncbi:hypothetical protein J1N35_035091 [Gossypium stocksii]|uniref:RNase H type-1 domain-containing protein n=1 Tax=Gossypium stocksii TaxID=47602 RepID=A0A9D3UTL0_9ROSI|nr:hypothetical protein J1N35_035091 [Gossypium stocksii]
MYWRVGSSSRISIWNDAWVPRLEDYRLQENVMGQHYNLVSELLDQYSRIWKEEIITYTMSADERVILEGDNLTVVKKLQNKNKNISEINPIIEDVKRASRGFVECRFNFVGRNTNETTHQLAKEGLVNGETSYLMERTPKAIWKATEEDSSWAELGHLHHFGFLGRDP